MAGAIKGITIEFRGDTTSLDRALSNVKKEAKGTANELKYIDKAIKFNPTSVDAWRQKQIVLNKAIDETKQKLSLMKQGLKEMEAQGLNEENSEEFRRMQREIDQTERELKSLQNELKAIGNVKLRAASEQFKQWGQQLENAGQKMRGLSMAAAAVTASIGALTVKSGKWADDLNTMSKRYGVGTQELQKYSVAADLVDTSTEAIVKSQTRLKKSMLSAEQGSKNQAAAFEKLGVDVTNADGSLRDGDAVFQDVITSLGKMTNETERDALAMQLMGKSANELNPLIEDGGETYKRVSETLKKYGLDFIDQETLDNANKFNDELDTIKAIGTVAFQSIGAQLAGYLAPALEKVVGWVGRFAEWLSNLSPRTLTIISAFAGFVAILSPLLIGLGKVSMGISAILSLGAKLSGMFGAAEGSVGLLGKAFAAINVPIAAVVGVVATLVAAFVHLWKTNEQFRANMEAIWKKLQATVGQFIGDLVSRIKEIVAIFKDETSAIRKIWDAFCNVLAPVFEGAFSAITTVLGTVFDVIIGILDVFIGIFTGDWERAWEGVKGIFESVWNGITSLFETVIQTIIGVFQAGLGLLGQLVTSMFSGIGSLLATIWEGIKTAVTGVWDSIVEGVKTRIEFLKLAITTVFTAVRDFLVSVWNGIQTIIATVWAYIVTTIQTRINLIRTVITAVFNAVRTFIKTVWNAIKTTITNAIQGAKDKVSSTINGIKNTVTTTFNALKSTVTSIWNGIKSAITKPIESAKNTVKSIIDKIKGFFPLKLGKILNFKLPKISIGTKEKTIAGKTIKVPDFDISWASHAAGGIFNRPTLLTDRNGGLHEVGDAGAEAIIPLDRFWNTLENNNAKTDSILAAQNRILIAMLQELQKDKDFKIDGRVAGRIVNDLVRG